MIFHIEWFQILDNMSYIVYSLKFLATRIWSSGVWTGLVDAIFKYFFHFLRGHQEVSINISHSIFGKIMRIW